MACAIAIQEQRRADVIPEQAISQACVVRFRPIRMTTVAGLFGTLPLPLAMGMGTGSEWRRPLGVAVVGGLLLSQLLTLYTTPVVYLAFERLKQICTRNSARQARSLVKISEAGAAV